MGYSGGGAYTLPAGSVVSDGTTIDAADLNTPLQDIETALNLAFLRDGRAAATGNWSMGTSYKITNAADGSALQDYATLKQVQNGATSRATSVGGAVDAVQVTFTPASTSWTSGERIRWTSGGANTVTDPTISRDGGSTSKTIKKGASAALAIGDLGPSGYECEGVYNGTDLILLNPYGSNDFATAAQYRDNTARKVLTTDQVWSAAGTVALTDAATVAVDFSAGLNFTLTIGGNRTLGQPSNQKVGQSGFIRIQQDGTGSRTLAYHADWKFAFGTDPILSTTAGAIDILNYEVTGANEILAVLTKAIA